ncbi:acid-sensing ion channel 1-like isoform X2 [Gigantopelta aegis]|nr:acid-sensing ion channel 1-like isoform X2 [Gigantopelta aegis]
MAPGTANFIKLQRTGYKFLPRPYRSYGDGYCAETSALLYQNYSYDRCVFQWINKNVHHDCNCSTLPIEGLPFKECSFLDIRTCTLWKSIKYYTQVAQMNVPPDDCPRPCEVVHYKPQMTSSAYPSQPALKSYANGPNDTEQYIRDNVLAVYVFYDRFLEERVEYVPEYTSMSILGNLSGQMGFFLGASLVTITEVAQTVLLTIWMFFCRFIKH